MKPAGARGLLVLACALAPALACQPTILSAHNSINPVLLGPVKALRNADVPLSPVGPFKVETMTFVASSGDASGNASASSMRTAATEADWAVVGATTGDPRRYVRLESVKCGGWAFFAIAGLWSMVTCEANGAVFDPPPGVGSIAAVHAPARAPAPSVPPPVPASAPPAASAPPGGVTPAAAEDPVEAPATPPPAAPQRRRPTVVPPAPPPILP
jgi:hypothetical protein